MARRLVLAVALVAALLPVAGAGGAPEQTPKRGGTVNVVVALEPRCLNAVLGCPVGPAQSVIEGAFKLAPDYTMRPRLISRVDIGPEEPFTLTYRIRPEARWSDGTPVSARDFVFTHEAFLAYPNPAFRHKTWVAGVRALGPKTVRVTLRSRYGYWRYLFPLVLPEHALRGQNLEEVWESRIDDPRTGRPIGNGPFLVQEWRRGEHLILVRNPRYWGPHAAYVDRLVFRFSLDPAVVADLFASGRGDIGQWQFDRALVPALRPISGLRLRFARDTPGWEHLDIRIGPGGHPALRNKLVRRALAYAIDRVAIVRAVVGTDVAGSPTPRDNLLYGKGSRSYRANWNGYRYRPAEARRLLERAGCQPGTDGIFSCAGRRLSLRFVSRNVIARRVRTLELVQAQARRAGIEVVPEYASSTAHDRVLETGTYDVTLFAFFGPGADGGGLDDLYGCGGAQNFTGYCQRLVTRDLDRADRIVRASRRARLLNAVDARLAADVPSIPLFEVPGLATARPAVRGFFASFSIVDPTWNAENWWLDD